jgi:hypothetical protein
MANLLTKIQETFSRLLEEKEEIKAVGQLQKELPPVLGWFIGAYISSFWYVAITNKRVIFVKLTAMSAPDLKKVYSVPLSDVQLEKNKLSVQTTNPDLPKRFEFYFGLKQATGLDKDAFILALAKR